MGVLLQKALKYHNDWKEASERNNASALKISVIIPAYYPQHLEHVIEHLIALDSFCEVIVVDDSGGRLLSSQLRAEYPNVRIIAHRLNLGRSAARNTGAAYAKGDILLFLDQDMYLSPSYPCQMELLFSANRGKAIVLGLRDTVPYDMIPRLKKWVEPSQFKDWRKETIITDSMIDITAVRAANQSNSCAEGKTVRIFESTQKLHNLGIAAETTFGYWDIASMVISHSMAIAREDFYALGGFPEWIEGWGGEDIVLGFLATAYKLPIILTNAVSYQEQHLPFSGSEQRKALELRRNIMNYQEWAAAINWFPNLNQEEIMRRGHEYV